MITIEQVLGKFKEHHSLADTEIIEKAYQFAQKNHADQKRKNGELVMEHLFQTAYLLAELKLDAVSIAAGFLHDILEYTPATLEELKKEFGEEIASLIEGLTFIEKVKYRHKTSEQKMEHLRKILLAMAKDIRVILIKLADRVHNMKTLDALPEEEQKRLASETLEIYAPLAYRLGINWLRRELEDLAFPYVHPQEYQDLLKKVKNKYLEGEEYIKKIIPLVKKILNERKIQVFEIEARTKHLYSLYQKLLRYDMDWQKIYDLVAVRIIVPDVESCYAALGVIHKYWKPLIGRIKDYIAIPKPNGYQSLHTTVFCEDGKITEFQIRTHEMDNEATFGIAAHWYYNERKNAKKKKNAKHKDIRHYVGKELLSQKPKDKIIKEIEWMKQLQEWQKEEFSSPEEFFNSLKIDFLRKRIFVFTPKGEVVDLPEGATPIDFAYHVHTWLGDHCSGAKVDDKLTALDHLLENGQVVEIIAQENKTPKLAEKTTINKSPLKGDLFFTFLPKVFAFRQND